MVTCWSTGLCCGNEPTCSDHERGRDAAVVPGWERRSSSTRSRAAPPVRPTVVVPTRNEARNPAPAPHLPLAARRAGHHRPGACAVTVALPERFAGRRGRPEDTTVLLVPAGRAVRLAPSATVPRRDWGGARGAPSPSQQARRGVTDLGEPPRKRPGEEDRLGVEHRGPPGNQPPCQRPHRADRDGDGHDDGSRDIKPAVLTAATVSPGDSMAPSPAGCMKQVARP